MFTVGTQNLDIMYTHHWAEASVVPIRVAQRLARIVNLLGVQQSLQDGFISFEDSAVLVQVGDADLVADILKVYEIFGKVGSEVLQFVAVVVNQPAVLYSFSHLTRHLHRRRTLHHLPCKRL